MAGRLPTATGPGKQMLARGERSGRDGSTLAESGAGNVTIKTASKFIVISVLNWHSYQDAKIEKGQQKGQQRAGERSMNLGRIPARRVNTEPGPLRQWGSCGGGDSVTDCQRC